MVVCTPLSLLQVARTLRCGRKKLSAYRQRALRTAEWLDCLVSALFVPHRYRGCEFHHFAVAFYCFSRSVGQKTFLLRLPALKGMLHWCVHGLVHNTLIFIPRQLSGTERNRLWVLTSCHEKNLASERERFDEVQDFNCRNIAVNSFFGSVENLGCSILNSASGT